MDKIQVRDLFYEDMEDQHGFCKSQILRILEEELGELTTFEVSKVKEYRTIVNKNSAKYRVTFELEAQIERNKQAEELKKCPICQAERLPWGKGKWTCSVGGLWHYHLHVNPNLGGADDPSKIEKETPSS